MKTSLKASSNVAFLIKYIKYIWGLALESFFIYDWVTFSVVGSLAEIRIEVW